MAESLTRVAVVMGGVSSEHEVSLGSGANVCNGLPRERYAVKPLVINPWNLDGLAEIERDTGRRVFTILQLRLHPARGGRHA